MAAEGALREERVESFPAFSMGRTCHFEGECLARYKLLYPLKVTIAVQTFSGHR